MARINLALATIEQLRSDWIRFRGIFDRSAKNNNQGVIFKYEYELGIELISTLEVGEVRSSVEYLTTSLDAHALVIATAIGAIAGAVIGALIGTLL